MPTNAATASRAEDKQDEIRSRADAVRVARRIAADIGARAGQTDRDRNVPRESVRSMDASGLIHVLTPKQFGGLDLGFTALFDVTLEIAQACGSTGWVYGVLAGHSWIVHMFPPSVQKQVLANGALSATLFRLGGTVNETGDGYRLTGGEGRFCSGVDHVNWIIVGNAVERADGSQEPHFFIINRADVEIVDDWDVVGMRGTGSKSIRVKDILIPHERALPLKDMLAGTTPGALASDAVALRLSFADVTPFSIVGVPLGCARAMVEAVRQDIERRIAIAGPGAPDVNTTAARLAAASAQIDAAIALVRESALVVDGARNAGDISSAERAKFPRNWAFAVQSARRAANDLFEVAGGSSAYNSSSIQRIWRDLNVGAQHVAFAFDRSMTNYGRQLLGQQGAAMAFGGKPATNKS